MELKEIGEELTKIKLTEEIITVEFIKRIFGKHNTVLDLSNHHLFEKSTSLLIKLLKSSFTSQKQIKRLIMQNCMMSSSCLIKIIKLFTNSSRSLISLDISNNRLLIEPLLTQAISSLFSKSSKLKSLSLQGNICTSAQAMAELFAQKTRLQQVNLYDTNLSVEALTVISQVLRSNAVILHLNLGFNSQAFEDPDIVGIFSESIAENEYLEELNLNGNDTLSAVENLSQLCKGLKHNRSLSVLKLGGINLEDFGLKILCTYLLNSLPLISLDVQNNGITDSGFKNLMIDFPINLTSLDISYNELKDNSSLLGLCTLLANTKSLRKLNISHSFELEGIDSSVLDLFCEAIAKNDSLSDLLCEGVKIPDDPDLFCHKLNEAIAYRKLSLTYKISAVNCFTNNSDDTSVSYNKSLKFISNIPSSLSRPKESYESTGRREFRETLSDTGRKEFVETPDQEPIINTSRHLDLSLPFD